MSPVCRLALLAAVALMSACATTPKAPLGNPQLPYPPPHDPQVGDVLHLPFGQYVSEETMLAVVSDARIVYVGETHDNPASHRLELAVLKTMAERYPGRVAVGLEMFTPDQQSALDRWVAGESSEKEFLKESNWYGTWRMDFAYYRDILLFAREHRIPVIGLNAPKDLVRQVGRGSAEELDPKLRAQLPAMDMDDPYQKALTEAIYGGHEMGQAGLDGFLRVQTLWDETMAQNIAEYLAGPAGKDRRMVVMAGGNHVRYGFGIPRRVFRRLPTSYALVGSKEVVIPEDKQDRLMDVEIPDFPLLPYDFMAFTAYESLAGEEVKLGVMLDDEGGRVRIAGVLPGSNAETADLRKEDILLTMDGEELAESFDVIYLVKQKKPGDVSRLQIERGGDTLAIEVIFNATPPAQHGHREK